MNCSADGSDVVDQPTRMHVRGQSSAREYAKKSYGHDPVDQIANISTWDTTSLACLGKQLLTCCQHRAGQQLLAAAALV